MDKHNKAKKDNKEEIINFFSIDIEKYKKEKIEEYIKYYDNEFVCMPLFR